MRNIIFIILAIIGLIIIFAIGWHFASQRWQLPCPAWLSGMVELDNPFSKVHGSASIVQNLEIKPGMVVLDAGSGPGRLTIPLALKVGNQGMVTALDIQEKMLERVQKKAQTFKFNNIIYINAGLGEGQLKHNRYDRALLVTVLGEIPNQKKALREIFDSLKSGGVLSITETLFDPHYQKVKKIFALAQEIGFQKKDMVSDWFTYNLLLKKP